MLCRDCFCGKSGGLILWNMHNNVSKVSCGTVKIESDHEPNKDEIIRALGKDKAQFSGIAITNY